MRSGSKDGFDNKFVINGRGSVEMKDYFCPFCNGKLFRGKISTINMPCPHCCRYVRNADFVNAGSPSVPLSHDLSDDGDAFD